MLGGATVTRCALCLLVAVAVGDGEAETGPLATSWHSSKFLSPIRDGAVLPILHLNGYKINNPTLLSRISHEELVNLFKEQLDVDEEVAAILVQEGFSSIEEIAYLNDRCDRLGMDTITAGNLCGLAIEASRRGIIDRLDTVAVVFMITAHGQCGTGAQVVNHLRGELPAAEVYR